MATDKVSLGSDYPTVSIWHRLPSLPQRLLWELKLYAFFHYTSHVSQRHSCSCVPQPQEKMTRSVCWQGPFSWIVRESRQVKSLHTRWSQLICFSRRRSLKTVYAAHIPIAGRKSEVNPVSGAFTAGVRVCNFGERYCCGSITLFGWNLEGSDSKHDLVICLDPPSKSNLSVNGRKGTGEKW